MSCTLPILMALTDLDDHNRSLSPRTFELSEESYGAHLSVYHSGKVSMKCWNILSYDGVSSILDKIYWFTGKDIFFWIRFPLLNGSA